jgi:CRISPR/Cas system-associated exonuclease Cas4 (RecB family)
LDCGAILCDVCFAGNTFHCEKCKPPTSQFKVIRRSHLEQYAICPYSLYLQLVKGVVIPDGEHAKLGTIVHQLIDKSRNKLLNYQECMDEFEVEFYECFSDAEDKELSLRLYDRGIASLKTVWSIMELFPQGEFTSELNIIYSIDEKLPSISCTLDEVILVGEDIHISDWKTGKPMSGQKLITDLQPPLYIEAVKQKYGKYPKTFTLYYLEEGKLKKYELTDESIPTYTVRSGKTDYTLNVQDALKRTREILTKINNGVFNMPSNGTHEWYCKSMCYFYKSEICASSVKEQWKILGDKYSKGELD